MLKYHSLRDKVFRLKNLYEAFKKVKKNKGRAGLDKVTIEHFEKELDKNIMSIHKHLKTQKYKPNPVLRIYIPKDKTSKRPLGIPIVRDRIIQQAFRKIIEPIFEKDFSDNSFGFRPNKSALDAIERIKFYKNQGYRYVLDTDIKAFFENIPHKIIMRQLCVKIADGWVLTSIENMLKAGVMEDNILHIDENGVPQGGVISPLLANLVGDIIDKELEKSEFKFVRYADDFVIMTNRKSNLHSALEFIKEIIEKKLNMELSENKTEITNFRKGFSFLGYKFKGKYLLIQDKSLKKFKDKIRYGTRRNQGINLEMVIKRLNPVIRGHVNYFKLANVKKRYRELDKWIRMRLRSFKFSRKWKTDNRRFPNKRFKKLKLISLQEHYLNVRT